MLLNRPRLRSFLLLALAAIGPACANGNGPNSGPADDRVTGQTDFTTVEQGAGAAQGPRGGLATSGAVGTGAGTAAPAATDAKNAAPAGRVADVQEADIYKLVGTRLYYFNTYRGFIVYDVADAKKPVLVSRLPVYGYPVEMFVDGNTIYALLRDALYLSEAGGKLQFQRHDVSQLVTIDVSDVAHPRVLKTLDIIGQLHEGVSRKIDKTIYVVSEQFNGYYWGWQTPDDNPQAQAWVYSYDVSDPSNPRMAGQLPIFQGGDGVTTDASGNMLSQRWFGGVAISATSNALMVVENWNEYDYTDPGNKGTGGDTGAAGRVRNEPPAVGGLGHRRVRSDRRHPAARPFPDGRRARRSVQDDLPVRRRHRPRDVLRHLQSAVVELHGREHELEPARVVGHHRRGQPETAGLARLRQHRRDGRRHGLRSLPQRRLRHHRAADRSALRHRHRQPGRTERPFADRRALRQHQRVSQRRRRQVSARCGNGPERHLHRRADRQPELARHEDGRQHHRRPGPGEDSPRPARVRVDPERGLELVERELEPRSGAQDAGHVPGRRSQHPHRAGLLLHPRVGRRRLVVPLADGGGDPDLGSVALRRHQATRTADRRSELRHLHSPAGRGAAVDPVQAPGQRRTDHDQHLRHAPVRGRHRRPQQAGAAVGGGGGTVGGRDLWLWRLRGRARRPGRLLVADGAGRVPGEARRRGHRRKSAGGGLPGRTSRGRVPLQEEPGDLADRVGSAGGAAAYDRGCRLRPRRPHAPAAGQPDHGSVQRLPLLRVFLRRLLGRLLVRVRAAGAGHRRRVGYSQRRLRLRRGEEPEHLHAEARLPRSS